MAQSKSAQVAAIRTIPFVISGLVDPSGSALVDAAAGTIYLQLSTPYNTFKKLDDGLTANWQRADGSQMVFVENASFVATSPGLYFIDNSAGAVVVTLPNATLNDQLTRTFISLSAAHPVTLTPVGGQTINGAATLVMQLANETVTIESNALNWQLLAEFDPRQILTFTSAASAGGAAAEAYVVTGLLATDEILSVTPKIVGTNNTAPVGFGTLINGGLTVTYTGNPGTGAKVLVTVRR